MGALLRPALQYVLHEMWTHNYICHCCVIHSGRMSFPSKVTRPAVDSCNIQILIDFHPIESRRLVTTDWPSPDQLLKSRKRRRKRHSCPEKGNDLNANFLPSNLLSVLVQIKMQILWVYLLKRRGDTNPRFEGVVVWKSTGISVFKHFTS